MSYIPKLAGLSAALILGACSSATTTAPVSVASVGSAAFNSTASTYSVTVSGTTTNLGSPDSFTTGGFIWINPAFSAFAFKDASVVAVGGITTPTNTPFSGITGGLSSVQTSGSATYTGRIGLVGVNPITGSLVHQNSILNLTADFGTGTISQNSDGVTIDGNITGSAYTGTVGWSGLTAPMAGGFYGTNTAAGAFSSSELAGAFLGTKP